jgi:hypothetical protein
MADQDRIKIERLGGFGGFGLSGSHLKSRGEVSESELSPADLKSLDALFKGSAQHEDPKPDAFRYRITREVGGSEKTIEVPEHKVPDAIKNSVQDTIE